ncbi:hypothetical protein Bfae_01620 [Brachybacterium faecium DSM 4810]|uniref:DUF624 domain-containing protein n=1 Tax=Brachybacterium faecium (strain ATCC 43885 / DSM 4810 / JCM 11609 / LMG 19847 / NBRC 14762 / NCIMB 9860 / 6-10) TaxID=446465 RepID=C7MFS5_BRAFD|nr:DUF624 domain-containing protein [Brachybacterium faecium]ACU84043.1 hypothetical protein Bfae_01620 [Brachybacterium faecium DSM 4810]
MTPTRRARGPFHEITEGVYWFLALDVLLLLAAAPTLLLWSVIGAGPLSALLFVLAAIPLLPALAAGLYTCRAWRTDHELIPARHFVRGYRLNALDSLRVGAPLLLVLGVLGVNITQGGAVGTSALALLFLALGVLVLLALVRAVSIVSAFSFRMIDVLRLAVFTLLARPLATLALLSLGVLVLGIVLVIGEFLLLFTASLLVFALWASERPVAALLTERFVGSSQPSADDAAPAGPRPEGS